MRGGGMTDSYVALDIETTGLNPAEDAIIEIGAVRVEKGTAVDSYQTFVNPGRPIPGRITQITGIDDGMVCNAPSIDKLIKDVIELTNGLPILGHNIIFDYSFLKKAASDCGMQFVRNGIDTCKLARKILPDLPGKSLEYLCGYFGIDVRHHRALEDAKTALLIYKKLCAINDIGGHAEELVYRPPKKEPITAKQKSYLVSLIARYQVRFEKDVNALTKSEASKAIDSIISTYGIPRRT